MSPTLREQGIETVHDEVVSLVAQRWAKVFVCKVTIKTALIKILGRSPTSLATSWGGT